MWKALIQADTVLDLVGYLEIVNKLSIITRGILGYTALAIVIISLCCKGWIVCHKKAVGQERINRKYKKMIRFEDLRYETLRDAGGVKNVSDQQQLESYDCEIEKIRKNLSKEEEELKTVGYFAGIKRVKVFIGAAVFSLIMIYCFPSMAEIAKRTAEDIAKAADIGTVDQPGNSREMHAEHSSDQADGTRADTVRAGAYNADLRNGKRKSFGYGFVVCAAQLMPGLYEVMKKYTFRLQGADAETFGEFCAKQAFSVSTDEFRCIWEEYFGMPSWENEERSTEALLAEAAENYEIPFLQSIADASKCEWQEEWESLAPSSEDLIMLMQKRIFIILRKDSTQYRRKLYFQLANDSQRMADECALHEKTGEIIAGYYCLSIYFGYCALQCERSSEKVQSDEDIITYIKARYKDMADMGNKKLPSDAVSGSELMLDVIAAADLHGLS